MTATVTYSDGVTPLAPYAHPMHGNDRANLGHAGQLWERLGEATPNLSVLSHATTAAIWEVGCRPAWRDVRGPQSRPIHHSGVIVARERVK